VLCYFSDKNKENTVCVLTNEFEGLPIIVIFKYVEKIDSYNVPPYCVLEAGNYNMVDKKQNPQFFRT